MASEKRLIDANALIAYFEEQCVIARQDQDRLAAMVEAALSACIDYFKIAPAVDAVEVVRCHKCRSWERNIPGQEEYGTCYCAGFNSGVVKHQDGYCDKGKRREDHGKH